MAHASLRLSMRERAVIGYAQQAAKEFGVPLPLILAVIRTESDFHADAVSAAGACGLMQLLPQTFLWLQEEKLCETHPDAAIFDPEINIRYGSYYLSYLLAKFDDTPTALAAYNAGEGRVSEWLCDPALSTDAKTLSRIPFSETERYVTQTLRHFRKYSEKYPF